MARPSWRMAGPWHGRSGSGTTGTPRDPAARCRGRWGGPISSQPTSRVGSLLTQTRAPRSKPGEEPPSWVERSCVTTRPGCRPGSHRGPGHPTPDARHASTATTGVPRPRFAATHRGAATVASEQSPHSTLSRYRATPRRQTPTGQRCAAPAHARDSPAPACRRSAPPPTRHDRRDGTRARDRGSRCERDAPG